MGLLFIFNMREVTVCVFVFQTDLCFEYNLCCKVKMNKANFIKFSFMGGFPILEFSDYCIYIKKLQYSHVNDINSEHVHSLCLWMI